MNKILRCEKKRLVKFSQFNFESCIPREHDFVNNEIRYLITKFPLILIIASEKTTPKIKRVQAWQCWIPLTSKTIPCFLEGLKFLRKNKTDFVRNFGICEESDEFRRNLINWIVSTLMQHGHYGPNNFAKYIFSMPVLFISNIKGFW